MCCGWRDFGNDWIHIDGGDYNHLDDNDVADLNIDDNTVDLIYCSHALEYWDREEVIPILQEWKRVLKPEGILRIAVPDFEAITKLYLNGNIFGVEKFLGPLYGKMKMGDKIIYHKTCYDYLSLGGLLIELGFKDFKSYDWRDTDHAKFDDHSQAYIPHMDKENGTLISLNVECTK